MPKKLKPDILEYLTKKSGFPESTIRVYLSKMRNKYPKLTINAAAQLIAIEHGGTVMAKLDINDKNSLPANINAEKDTIVVKKNKSKTAKEITFCGLGQVIKSQPPLITEVMFKELQLNLQAYHLLYLFENSIREFINQVLTKKYSSNWWMSEKFDAVFKNQIEKTRVDRHPWLKKKKVHEVYLLELEQLIHILSQRKTVFDPYFRNMGKYDDTNWLISKISDVNKIRRIVMHDNPILIEMLNSLRTDVLKWLDQMSIVIDKIKN